MADLMSSTGRSTASAGLRRDPAKVALKRFLSVSESIRGAAILDSGRVVAASGDEERWLEAGVGLLAAADAAAGEVASHAHVATEEGEAYAVRAGDRAMVAVTGRFDLSSLVLADMRRALREAA